MRISSFFIPFFALLAGIGGFFLRMSELMNVFDRVTELPERGAALSAVLAGVSAAVVVAAVIFALRTSLRYTAQYGFDDAFGTDSYAYPIAFTAIGVVWLVATIIHFLNLNSEGAVTRADLIFAVMSALSAVSLVFFTIEMYKNPRRKSTFVLSLVPTLFLCFWLILLYRENASNPVLLSYAYKCLAIMSAALGFYFSSSFVFGKPAVGKAIVSYVASIYFGCVTLADNHPMGIILIFSAIVVMNILYLSMLIRNLSKK